MRPRATASALVAAVLVAAPAAAGTFVGVEAVSPTNVDLVMHPFGYDGTGGTLTVTVCIDPASANDDMVTPVKRIVNTYNLSLATSPNLFFDLDNNIPSTDVDFESVALHEIGHCLGLGHVNLATESGVGCATSLSCDSCDSNHTKTTDGVDDAYDLDDGADDIIGSNDDLRGDDVNYHWFRTSNNNPFTLAKTVDSSTYSRLEGDLPGSHDFIANAERCVGADLGSPDTEAVMQQGTFGDEEQRELNHDDIATLRYGMSGLDETAGTSDDYTIHLDYVGRTTSCDIPLDFDDFETAFAVCQTSFSQISGDHWGLTAGDIFFHTGPSWFFNDCKDKLRESETLTTETIEACRYVIGGDGAVVDGDVTFRAGRSVVLTDGFKVKSGSSFTAEVDTSLAD